jgi:hypothetical protein
MCIRRSVLNLRFIRKRTGRLEIVLAFCLLPLIGCWVIAGNEADTHGSLDSLSIAKNSTDVKPEAFTVTNNSSSVKIENGIPKLSVNGKIINNMFGIYVYCTGVDPRTNQFLVEMKEVIDRTSNLDIPIMSFDILWRDYDRSASTPRDAQEAANRFYTKNLDELLDYAARKKVYVVFQLLVHAHWGLPIWWKNYKDNKHGYQLIDDASNASIDYNRLQSPVASYQSMAHRELLRALLKRLVVRYKNHPAIVGWGINLGPTGENGYTPNGVEVFLNPQMPKVDFRLAMADYSVVAKKNFTLWLERKYGNIKRLNASWNTLFNAFDQVIPPAPRKITLHETFNLNGDSRTSMKDWQGFRHDAIIDEWSFLSALVKNQDPGKIIMGKTSWFPTEKSTGTSHMLISAVAVNEKQLIDVDKLDCGITEKDYLPEIPVAASRIDYADMIKFNRKYGALRVCNLENATEPPGHIIEIERSIAVKNAIRDEGGYLWFVVALEHDRMSKPRWSWKEITKLVKNSNNNELKSVIIKDPPVLFYFDVGNLMSNYFEAHGDLILSKLYRGITRVFFDNNPKLNYDFISSSHLAEALFLGKTRLLIMANQRYIANEIAEKLRKYVSKGGMILLVGSNGVFDASFNKDAQSIRTLAPQLSDRQLQALYDWGLQDDIRVPFIVVSANGSRYIEVSLKGDPGANYRQLAAALPITLGLSKNGKLFLSSLNRPIPHRMRMPNGLDTPRGSGQIRLPGRRPSPGQGENFIRDFDMNGDGVVSREEFSGPVEIFNRLDINRDGVITKEEAEADDMVPFQEK